MVVFVQRGRLARDLGQAVRVAADFIQPFAQCCHHHGVVALQRLAQRGGKIPEALQQQTGMTELAQLHVQMRLGEIQCRRVADGAVVEVAQQRTHLMGAMGEQQLPGAGACHVAGGQVAAFAARGVANRVGEVLVFAEPARRTLMNLQRAGGVFAIEQLLQKIGEQRVVAKPFALAILRDQQAMEMFQPGQQPATVVALAYRIGQGCVNPLQWAGAQQQVARVRIQVVDHLFGQIRRNLRVAPGKPRGYFLLALRAAFQPQPGQMQGDRPAFGIAA